MAGIFELKGTIKHYDWGGFQFIRQLLHENSPENDPEKSKPDAEYWLGDHPLSQATLHSNQTVQPLSEYINADKDSILGSHTSSVFNRLPFLLKVLDVREMLSIQVHPNRADAIREFNRENNEGIALDAPNRNYKDDNHKPELASALGEFWLLHGFQPESKLLQTVSGIQELKTIGDVFLKEGYRGMYTHVMQMPQEHVNKILGPLLDRIIPLYQAGKLDKSNPDFWAARAALTFNQGTTIDRGIFSIYFFNLVKLQNGEGIFQDAGIPHAYLEGQNVEIMANSDNVLRGGLTVKHIDVPQLLAHTSFKGIEPKILRATGDRTTYPTPAPDFELTRFSFLQEKSFSWVSQSAEILLCTQGSILIGSQKNELRLGEGHVAAFINAGQSIIVKSTTQDAIFFKAAVPE